MANWKYLVAHIDLSDKRSDTAQDVIQSALDQASAGGWELVSLLPSPLGGPELLMVVKKAGSSNEAATRQFIKQLDRANWPPLRCESMSRENRHFNLTVDGTLIGAKTYSVKVILTMHERWGTGAVPDAVLMEREELLETPGVAVEDGDYVLKYSLDNKDYELNRKVMEGRLIPV